MDFKRKGFMNNMVVGVDMSGATRPLLILGAGLVLLGAMVAGLFAGEYTLTLALGALTATLIGLVMMMQTGAEQSGQRVVSIDHESKAMSRNSEMQGRDTLPDPMEQDFDMPL